MDFQRIIIYVLKLENLKRCKQKIFPDKSVHITLYCISKTEQQRWTISYNNWKKVNPKQHQHLPPTVYGNDCKSKTENDADKELHNLHNRIRKDGGMKGLIWDRNMGYFFRNFLEISDYIILTA